MIQIQHIIVLLVGLAVCDFSVADSAVYSGQGTTDAYLSLKILLKPGNCRNNSDYPNTFQCAETKRCLSFPKDFNNSKCDCCGPDKNCSTCSDQSDENRMAPGNYGACKDHPHSQYGLVYPCAKNRNICISRILHWNNGQCDCCPDQGYACGHPNCTDHSDEECAPNEWNIKFSCDGNCIALNKLSDNETDCFSDCNIEENEAARTGCEKRKNDSTQKSNDDFCNMCAQKNTPYYKCPTGQRQCVTSPMIRDKTNDCAAGEDEDPRVHPDCPASLKATKCDVSATACYMIGNKADMVECRCPQVNGTTVDMCNKDGNRRRKRLF